MQNCQDLIDDFEDKEDEKRRIKELRAQEEAEGHYEVQRILEVKFTKVSASEVTSVQRLYRVAQN